MRIDEMLYGIKASTSSHAWFTWVSADFLEEHEIRPWADMPVWIPPEGKGAAGGLEKDEIEKSEQKGRIIC